ncbi:hypothetical protein HK099_008548 [Clydaea vesicula]|uniref:Peptide hydrolase n=1 Tax=Clydaea vesicula TaxID=447962 RepID=A0AAD5U656_9FUNG|nr:hypothetical protein HK099_008548 [Clydaea vesicula]
MDEVQETEPLLNEEENDANSINYPQRSCCGKFQLNFCISHILMMVFSVLTQKKTMTIMLKVILIYSFFALTWLVSTGILQISHYSGLNNKVSFFNFGVGRLPNAQSEFVEVFTFNSHNAFGHTKEICSNPHMYNSDQNLKVREYIIKELENIRIKTNSCFEIIENDNINYLSYKNWWYESNNILVRLPGKRSTANGKDNESLLISAHFDTTSVSPGVTDDGIGIGVMLETIRTLMYVPQLEYDVIFNFNNGEEMGLLGGNSFLLHPWSKSVRGFINLEGTGSAAGKRSLLFRSNSMVLAKEYKKSAPYPHASVLFNDLMQFVGSDTDYRPYASIHHMGENLFSMIVHTCGSGSKAFKKMELLSPVLKDKETLPLPNFVFYDILGIKMFVEKHDVYFLLLFGMLISVFAVLLLKGLYEIKFRGTKLFLQLFFRPVAESTILVFVCAATSLISVFILSFLKWLINPASSYGYPEMNLIWIVFLTLFDYTMIQAVFPKISRSLHLRSRGTTIYSPLPTNEFSETSGETTDLTYQHENNPQPLVDDWLPHGLLLFWFFVMFAVTYFSYLGYDGPVVLTYWFSFSTITALISFFANYKVDKYWRLELVDNRLTKFQYFTLRVYENYWGIIILATSTWIPFLLTMDTMEEIVSSMPSLIAEGLPSFAYDCVIAFIVVILSINVLPAFHSCNYKFLAPIFLIGFLIPYLMSTIVKPFSYDRPHKMVFKQMWNLGENTSTIVIEHFATLSNKAANDKIFLKLPWFANGTCSYSGNNCTYEDVTVPKINAPNHSSKLIEVYNLKKKVENDYYIYTGNFTGSAGSRICELKIDNYSGASDDDHFGIWLEYENFIKWRSIDGNFPFNPLSKNKTDISVINYKLPAVIFKRNFGNNDRIEGNFLVRINPKFITDPVKLAMRCFHSELITSEAYQRLTDEKFGLPNWMTVSNYIF